MSNEIEKGIMKIEERLWKNAKCDVLALWSHIWYGSGIFVTGDNNFLKKTKKPALITLGAGEIAKPEEVISGLIASVHGP